MSQRGVDKEEEDSIVGMPGSRLGCNIGQGWNLSRIEDGGAGILVDQGELPGRAVVWCDESETRETRAMSVKRITEYMGLRGWKRICIGNSSPRESLSWQEPEPRWRTYCYDEK